MIAEYCIIAAAHTIKGGLKIKRNSCICNVLEAIHRQIDIRIKRRIHINTEVQKNPTNAVVGFYQIFLFVHLEF